MSNIKKLTLLHSNDLHGDFFKELNNDKFTGGVSMLSGYVKKVKNEDTPCIYAIAGDMFRGSIIDSEYKGFSTIDIMNVLDPDIVTLGNHELDYGLAQLLFLEKAASFPIVNANLYIKNTGRRLFKPYKIIEIDGMKILFIGIITQEIMDYAKTDQMLETFVSVEEAATEVEKVCDAYKSIDIDLTVLLTHIGHENDIKLAKLLSKTSGVDMIIGGHSHTVLEKPDIVNDILIAQAGVGSDQIGRYDLLIDTDKNTVKDYKWQLVPIDDTHCKKDESVKKLIENYAKNVDVKYARVICRLKKSLNHESRYQETEAGNFFADVLKDATNVDFVLLGSGSLRKPLLDDIITKKSLMEFFPFSDSFFNIKINGRQIKELTNFLFNDRFQNDSKEFYQWSKGIKIIYNKESGKVETLSLNGKEFEDEKIYKLGMQNYHFQNSSKYLGIDLTRLENTQILNSDQGVMEERLSEGKYKTSNIEGRIVVF